MTEKTVEKSLCDLVKRLGGIAYKFVSPGRRGVPDRLCLLPIKDEGHRKIVAQYVKFVECKAPDGQVRPEQWIEMDNLSIRGYTVKILRERISSKETGFPE